MGGQVDRRAMRVFVSSTFRDMQAERDELVKRVFPRIRRLCEQRGVTWSEVDLRWGVTDEQKAEGAVLPICLAEIDRTRPYFIGVLGQRYGWVPDALPADLAGAMPWLAEDRGRSVTEMEIVHGVLDRPPADVAAFFYLRRPEWVEQLAPDAREIYVEADPVGRARLEALRDRIERSGHPVAHYSDPAELGELVLADLEALVERLHPPDGDPTRRDDDLHRAFGAARFRPWVARPDLERRLDDHAASGEVPLLLTGEHGVGCSALATNWATGWASRHPGATVVIHHADADTDAADHRAVVARLVAVLDPTVDVASTVDRLATASPPQLRAAITRAAASRGESVVVVLDNVDRLHDVDRALDLSWLPDALPARVRLVVTGHDARVRAAFERRAWTVEHVPTLTTEERRAIATAVLAASSKALTRELLDLLVAAERCANARFLVTVLDELRQHGDHFTLRDEIVRLTSAATLDDLLELLLARYERDFERERPGLTRDVFTALWAARTGLAEPELLQLLARDGEPLPHAVWAPLHLASERGLVGRGGLLGFAHADLRRAVEDRYLPTAEDRRQAHARLADFFARRPLSGRVTDELGWQLLLAGEPEAFATTLGDLDHFELAYRRQPADVRRMWSRYGTDTGEYGSALRRVYAAVIADPGAHVRAAPGRADQLVWGLARVLEDAGEVGAALPLHRVLVDSARRAPAGQGEGDGGDARLRASLVNLGAAEMATGELELAAGHLDEAVGRCRRAGDDAMLTTALHDLAIVRRRQGDRSAAATAATEVLELARRRDDDDAVQAALGELVIMARDVGDPERALALLDEQEAVARRLADPLAVDAALAGRATLHADRGELAVALDHMERRVALMRAEGLTRNLAEALLNLAVTRLQVGDADAASAAADEAEHHARVVGSPDLLARVLVARAGLAGAGADWQLAEQLAGEAALTARAAAATHELAVALGHLGTARRERGDLDGAETAHREELQLATVAAEPAAIANARGNLGNLAMARGRHTDARREYDAAIDGFRALGLRPSLLPLLANRAQLRHADGDPGAAADYVEAAEIALASGAVDGARQWAEPALQLAYGAGDVATAERAWEVMEQVARANGDDHGLQLALGERALLVIGRAGPGPGRPAADAVLLTEAASLLGQQEAVCRRTADDVGLAACVGNLAIVARYRGDLDGSLARLDEQLAIASRSGNAHGVLLATANRGEVLGLLGRTAEARDALQAARATAQAHGLLPMVQQLDGMLAALTRPS